MIKHIEETQQYIRSLYNYNTSHITSNGDSLVSLVCGVEKLVQNIDDEKQRLENYIRESKRRLRLLANILNNYSPKDKSVVESYFKRQVPQPNNKVIQRLRRDLWKIEAAQKKRRQAAKQYYEEIEEKKRIQKLKENMQQTMAH
ncbi:hypothetical protein [Staphylococcus kloosii]|uniref:hypothetical protein n=1 Tax=Staphylococcus kloosii TaxID=29384 RepID=UPI0018A06F25|nr:hypothetical protein [Staphylococcus kloosii]MBF7023647.1 hypothetical protein [Staphylococcus kloosii]